MRTHTFSIAAVVFGLFLVTTPLAAQFTGQSIIVEPDQVSNDLGTVRLWHSDGATHVRGQLPEMKDMERATLKVTGVGGWTSSNKKVTEIEASKTRAWKPVKLSLVYRNVSRPQSATPRATCEIETAPAPGQAVVVTFRLAGDEEVRCAKQTLYWRISEGPSRPLTGQECREDRQLHGLPAADATEDPCELSGEEVRAAID